MPVHVNYMLVLNHKQTKLNFINTRFTTTVCPPRQNSFQSSNLTLSAERHSMSLVCTHNYVHVHRAKKQLTLALQTSSSQVLLTLLILVDR